MLHSGHAQQPLLTLKDRTFYLLLNRNMLDKSERIKILSCVKSNIKSTTPNRIFDAVPKIVDDASLNVLWVEYKTILDNAMFYNKEGECQNMHAEAEPNPEGFYLDKQTSKSLKNWIKQMLNRGLDNLLEGKSISRQILSLLEIDELAVEPALEAYGSAVIQQMKYHHNTEILDLIDKNYKFKFLDVKLNGLYGICIDEVLQERGLKQSELVKWAATGGLALAGVGLFAVGGIGLVAGAAVVLKVISEGVNAAPTPR